MNHYEARQNRERLEQYDSNIWFMSGRLDELKKQAEAEGKQETAEAYKHVLDMLDIVKDDEDLKKKYPIERR